jgi:hypothetical protein
MLSEFLFKTFKKKYVKKIFKEQRKKKRKIVRVGGWNYRLALEEEPT